MFSKNAFSAGILLCIIAVALGEEPKLETLPQNWSNPQRHQFWFIDQGSKIIPLDWFLNLECGSAQGHCDQTRKFASTANLESYGFVADTSGIAGDLNPHHLPIGFSSGSDDTNVKYVGLTCAACHTGNIKYNGRSILVDGAPAMLNFNLFLDELVDALTETLADSGKLQRLRASVPSLDISELRSRTNMLAVRRRINTPDHPAGYGRVDAFGHIFNQIAVEHLGDPETAASRPNAPASYPMLWDIAKHWFVQWNYSAPNLGVGQNAVGSLMRNIGEVLGVFGELEITPQKLSTPAGDIPLRPKYASSANIDNLREIEKLLVSLQSPRWPFSPLNASAIERGRSIYDHACKACHATVGSQPKPYGIAEIGTDSTLATNFLARKAPAGKLEGVPKGFLLWGAPIDPLGLSTFKGNEYLKDLTAHITLNLVPDRLEQAEAVSHGLAQVALVGTGPYYKARPLNGIWATAPYLHNGSVPTLADMLKPAAARPVSFCVGDGNFDPVNVGYLTYPGPNCPDHTELVDTTVVGSYRIGHEYGVTLGDAEKVDLIEYLKSL